MQEKNILLCFLAVPLRHKLIAAVIAVAIGSGFFVWSRHGASRLATTAELWLDAGEAPGVEALRFGSGDLCYWRVRRGHPGIISPATDPVEMRWPWVKERSYVFLWGRQSSGKGRIASGSSATRPAGRGREGSALSALEHSVHYNAHQQKPTVGLSHRQWQLAGSDECPHADGDVPGWRTGARPLADLHRLQTR